MGSLGFPEIAFILVLALLIFGPNKLADIGRTLGRGVAEFRKATNELKRSISTELALDETPTPPVLRPRRLEDPAETARYEAAAAAPGAAPAMTEARTVPFPVAAPEPAAPEPVAAPGHAAGPDLPEPG